MKKITIAASALAGVTAITAAGLYAIAPGIYDPHLAKPFNRRYFAHRGLYTEDKTIPENSLAAFKRATDAGYGMELDVQLSKDGSLVIYHDDNLRRIFNIDKRINELTLEELKELRLYGTEESFPTLQEVLEVVNGRVPLIVELKPATGKKRIELCQKTLDALKEYKERTGGDYCVESFDPFIVKWFKKNAPDIYRGQLTMAWDSYDSKIPYLMRKAMSLCLFNFAGRPHFIAYDRCNVPAILGYTKKLGAQSVAWTSKNPEDCPGADTIIFEFYEPPQGF